MRTRLAATVATAAALLALTACSSAGTDDAKASQPPAASTGSAATTAPAATTGAAPTGKAVPGMPPEPTGTARTAYLTVLAAIAPAIVANPDKAVEAGRNQCTILDHGGRNPDHSAAASFGSAAHPLTDTQGKEINAALRMTLCPKK